MKFEFSAGGIVFKKEKKTIVVLVSQHSQHHGWVFPKGFIGDTVKGESKEETAVREVEEETGVKAKILEPLEPVTYWYQMRPASVPLSGTTAGESEKRKKTVYYYIMEYISGDIANHDWEMENVEWLPMNEVEERLTYYSDKKVWEKAYKIISNLQAGI